MYVPSYYDYGNIKTEAIDLIEKCQNKIKEEEKKIADCTFNIDTYKLRMIDNIRGLYINISTETLRTLWHGFNNKEKITDEEETKKYKNAYDFVDYIIKQDIISDTKCSYKKKNLIEEVISCGYESYAYSIKFIANKIKFVIEIPVVKHINTENYIYARYGKYCLAYYSSNYCQECIKESYNFDDIKKAFKEFIEKESNNA